MTTQAGLQVKSIVQMVAALECDYDRLEELKDEREASGFPSRALCPNPDHTGGWWEDEYPSEAEELDKLTEAAGEHTDQDGAREAIQENPLSVEVRSAWASVGEILTPDEFRVVLCTGGPHVELVGVLDDNREPSRVRVIFKDWGEGGEYYPDEAEREALMTYLGQLYFGG